MQLRRHSQLPALAPAPSSSSSTSSSGPAIASASTSASTSTATPIQRVPDKSVRRTRRRVRSALPREEQCGMCAGNDAENARGEAERMLTCCVCSRSVHPSCNKLGHLADVCFSYDWECFKCKVCSVCARVKENDQNHMVFCDSCDRGWHQFCMLPPLVPMPGPKQEWFCPVCTGVPLSEIGAGREKGKREVSRGEGESEETGDGETRDGDGEGDAEGDEEEGEEQELDEDAEGEPDPSEQGQEPDEEMQDGEDNGDGDDDDEDADSSHDEDYTPDVDVEVDEGEDADADADGSAYEGTEAGRRNSRQRSTSRTRTKSNGASSKVKSKVKSKSHGDHKGKGKMKALVLPEHNRHTRRDSSRHGTTPFASSPAPPARGRGRPKTKASSPPARTPTPPPLISPTALTGSFSHIRRLRLKIKPLTTPAPTPPPEPAPVQPQGRNIIKLPTKLITKELLKQQQAFERSQFAEVLDDQQANCDATRIDFPDKRRWEAARKRAEERMSSAPSASTSAFPFPALAPALSRAESMSVLAPTPRHASPFVGGSGGGGLALPPLRSTRSHLFHQLSEFSTPPGSAPETPRPASASAAGGPGGAGLAAVPAGPQRVKSLRFGAFDIDTWYDAPFPEEYAHVPDGKMWICEFCLKYGKSAFGNLRHRMKCKARHPPGDEIYRAGNVSVFEVDGRKNKIYCQNLCLLAKMFLDHKTLFYDVEPFLFYVMTEMDDVGARFVGYFSKEKRCPSGYNVSCIMTLPAIQRKGWGNLLIGFSYLLSKKEGRVGTPERPLSGLGEVAYRNYWTLAINQFLQRTPADADVKFEHISAATAMTIPDIVRTLTELGMLEVHADADAHQRTPSMHARGQKKGRGRPPLARASARKDDEVMIPTSYSVKWDAEAVRLFCERWDSKGYLRLQPDKLKWSPFIMDRTKKTDTVGMHGLGAANLGAGLQPHINGLLQAPPSAPAHANGKEPEPVAVPPADDVEMEVEEVQGHAEPEPPQNIDEAGCALDAVLEHAELEVHAQETQTPRRRGRPSKAALPNGHATPTPSRRTRSALSNVHTADSEPTFEELPTPAPRQKRKRSEPEPEPEPAPEPEVERSREPEPEPESEPVKEATPSREATAEPEERAPERPSPAKKRRIAPSPPQSPVSPVVEAVLSPELGMDTAPVRPLTNGSADASPDPLDLIVAPPPPPPAPVAKRGRGRPPGSKNLVTPHSRRLTPNANGDAGRRTRSMNPGSAAASGSRSRRDHPLANGEPASSPLKRGRGRPRNAANPAQRVVPLVSDDDDDDEPVPVAKPATRSSVKGAGSSPLKPAPAPAPAEVHMDDLGDEDAEGEVDTDVIVVDDEDEDAEGEPDPDVAMG